MGIMLFFMRECLINLFAAAESKHARGNVIQRVNCEYLLIKTAANERREIRSNLGLTSKLVSAPHLQVSW
jgi:hypothetical protein